MNIVSELRDRNRKADLGDNLCARAADEIERLSTELDVYRRYINRDISAQIEQAFETKAKTGKFPFED